MSFRFRDGTQLNGIPVDEAVARITGAIATRALVDTAEDQRRRYELSEWIRECWYAGILGVDLPPAPPWYVEPRMITGIVCEPARTRRRGQSPFAMKSRR